MKLAELLDDLDGLEPDEKLECLMDLAAELPPLSEGRGIAPFPASCLVQECQTPVHLWVEVREGGVHLEADVPRKSPTVRGLVSLVVQGLKGATPQQVAAMPDDLVALLGLSETLGMTRQHGMRGLIARIKREVSNAAPSETPK